LKEFKLKADKPLKNAKNIFTTTLFRKGKNMLNYQVHDKQHFRTPNYLK